MHKVAPAAPEETTGAAQQQFLQWCRKGNLAQVQQALDDGFNPNFVYRETQTFYENVIIDDSETRMPRCRTVHKSPLSEAIYHEQEAVAKCLIDHGQNPQQIVRVIRDTRYVIKGAICDYPHVSFGGGNSLGYRVVEPEHATEAAWQRCAKDYPLTMAHSALTLAMVTNQPVLVAYLLKYGANPSFRPLPLGAEEMPSCSLSADDDAAEDEPLGFYTPLHLLLHMYDYTIPLVKQMVGSAIAWAKAEPGRLHPFKWRGIDFDAHGFLARAIEHRAETLRRQCCLWRLCYLYLADHKQDELEYHRGRRNVAACCLKNHTAAQVLTVHGRLSPNGVWQDDIVPLLSG